MIVASDYCTMRYKKLSRNKIIKPLLKAVFIIRALLHKDYKTQWPQ